MKIQFKNPFRRNEAPTMTDQEWAAKVLADIAMSPVERALAEIRSNAK